MEPAADTVIGGRQGYRRPTRLSAADTGGDKHLIQAPTAGDGHRSMAPTAGDGTGTAAAYQNFFRRR
jgi:hypothetical protein